MHVLFADSGIVHAIALVIKSLNVNLHSALLDDVSADLTQMQDYFLVASRISLSIENQEFFELLLGNPNQRWLNPHHCQVDFVRFVFLRILL